MATKKISQLTNAAALGGTEQIPLVQAGVTLKATPNQMATFMQTALNLSQYVTNASLASTLASYVTNASLASTLTGYVTTGTLANYVTNASLASTLSGYVTTGTLANYVTNASLASTLASYVTSASLSSTLANYVTNASLASTLSSYVTNASLASTLSSYVTNASLATTLSSYVTNVSLSSTLSNYVTSFALLSTLSAYVLNTTLTGTLANYVSLAGTQSITGTKTFSNSLTKFYTNLGINPSASGGGAPVNWVSRFGNLVQTKVLDMGLNTAGAVWFQNYDSTDDQSFGVIALNPNGGDVVVNRITSAGYKFDVSGTFRNANSAYLATTAGGAVGIGLVTIDATAQLHMSSTTKGALLPRLTTTQINAIVSPANGLILYNTTINHMCVYYGTAWVKLSHTPM
jgi:hypothetical protein